MFARLGLLLYYQPLVDMGTARQVGASLADYLPVKWTLVDFMNKLKIN